MAPEPASVSAADVLSQSEVEAILASIQTGGRSGGESHQYRRLDGTGRKPGRVAPCPAVRFPQPRLPHPGADAPPPHQARGIHPQPERDPLGLPPHGVPAPDVPAGDDHLQAAHREHDHAELPHALPHEAAHRHRGARHLPPARPDRDRPDAGRPRPLGEGGARVHRHGADRPGKFHQGGHQGIHRQLAPLPEARMGGSRPREHGPLPEPRRGGGDHALPRDRGPASATASPASASFSRTTRSRAWSTSS